MNPKVSIIIVNWNGGVVTKNCIDSIQYHCKNDNYEIILVDNNSTDDSISNIMQENNKVKLVKNEMNIGFAAANNIGIQYANGNYLLLLNSDTLFLDDNITKMIENIENESDDVAMLSCKILNSDRTLQRNCYDLPSIKSYFMEYYLRYRGFNKKFKYTNQEIIPCISGAYMFIRKSYVAKHGLFDERYYFYQEDTDLCMNLYKMGLKIKYFDNSSVIHLGGVSTKPVQAKMFVQMHKNRLLYVEKHYSRYSFVFFRFMTKMSLSVDFIVSFLKILLLKMTLRQFLSRVGSYTKIIALK